jgi:hypothetical protein
MTKPKFTKDDIELLLEESALKARLASIKESTDAKRKQLADTLGEGSHKVAGYDVEIKTQLRNNTSWKDVAFALASEEAVNQQKVEFTKNIEVVSVKVIEKE